jgi:L-gulonate 3-dehydrogenase
MKVACIGAGTVGHAWAVAFASAGHEVALYDVIAGEVEARSLPKARETLELLVRGGMIDEPADVVAARISAADSVEAAVAGAGYVQESAREDVEVKRQVFTTIAAAAPREAILASSTSAIPGSEFLLHIAEPERALVVHPVNPPSLIPLVELCATPRTSGAVLAAARAFMVQIGMKPVTVLKEIDGFLLNRLQYTLVAEALHLVGEGYCSAEDIDAVMTHGLAMRWASIGPFEVAHLNAPDGFMGFVNRFGPMMRRLGADARADYDWSPELAERIHAGLTERVPIAQIPSRQAWRNERIVALRKFQASAPV